MIHNKKKSVRMKTRKADMMDAKKAKEGGGLTRATKSVFSGAMKAMGAATKMKGKMKNLGKNFKGAYGGKTDPTKGM